MKKLEFGKIELKHLLISVLVLAVLYLYNKLPSITDASDFLVILIQGFLIFAIALFANMIFKKLVARAYDHKVEYRVWSIKRIWFTESEISLGVLGKVTKEIPIGIIIPLLVSLISGGVIIFSAVGVFILTSQMKVASGRERPYITEYETAKIAFIGPLTNLGIALIFSFFLPYFDVREIINLNIWMAVFNMIPLPNLDGSQIYFGGRAFYIFCLVFTILVGLALTNISFILALILAVVLATIISLLYLFWQS